MASSLSWSPVASMVISLELTSTTLQRKISTVRRISLRAGPSAWTLTNIISRSMAGMSAKSITLMTVTILWSCFMICSRIWLSP